MTRSITFLLALFIISSESIACDCPGMATVKNEVTNSDLVITAKIISKQIVESFETIDVNKNLTEKDTPKPIPTFQYKEVLYKVAGLKKFKRAIQTDTVFILTGLGGGDCGYSFKVGEK